MADNTTELEVLDQIVDVLGGQSGQYETVVPTLQQILALLGGGGGGYNPSLSVGRADSLTGADSTAQWATRESTGTGSATVRSVQGAAVVWNQLNDNGGIANTTGLTLTHNEDGSVTLNGTASSGTCYLSSDFNYQANHKILVRGCPSGGGGVFDLSMGGLATDTGAGAIASYGSSVTTRVVFTVRSSYTFDNVTFWPQLFDLTAMFGSGNEPSIVAEFEAMYPESYYPYSAPTLKPVQIAGIRSTTAQGGELDSVEWPTQTLRAAGSVRDELTSDELVTRVGVVDLGTLTWYASSVAGIFSATVEGMAINATAQGRLDGLACASYPVDTVTNVDANMNDKTMKRNNGLVYIRDNSYTTSADFKAAMSGVLLFYELATPTTTPISPALPMTYRVQAGGSEAIIVPDGEISAAPVLTIAEGESAAELVMDALACIATPDGPTATANHAINTYLTMGGKLYKVTSAIAVGETIKSGTNVSQTTVMAELIARTA